MKPKIEKQKTSRQWILIHLANAFGMKQNGLYNREDYRFKKTQNSRAAGQIPYRDSSGIGTKYHIFIEILRNFLKTPN